MSSKKILTTLFVIFLTFICDFSLAESKHNDIFGKDWVLREDLPVLSEPKVESLLADIYQKDAQLPIAFSLSPCSNIKNVDCPLHFNPMYFFVLGKPFWLTQNVKF